MEIIINDTNELKLCRDQLALEFFSLKSTSSFLTQLLPGIISSFKNTKQTVDLPNIKPLDKDQKAFLNLLKEVPYTEVGELRAYTPEGMGKTYLEYLNILLHVTEYVKTIQGDVLQPYVLFLAQLLSDKQSAFISDNNKREYDLLEKHRDGIYKEFSKMYVKDSYAAETKVKAIVDRNADWVTVLTLLNQCVANMESIDRELIKRQVKQCSDYLNLIYDGLKKDSVKDTSQEAAARLSNGAYNVAKELELAATTYYRVLAMSGSVKNTIDHIKNTLG
jgi:hypothetical protein